MSKSSKGTARTTQGKIGVMLTETDETERQTKRELKTTQPHGRLTGRRPESVRRPQGRMEGQILGGAKYCDGGNRGD